MSISSGGSRWLSMFRQNLPGIGYAIVISVIAYIVNTFIPLVSALLFAILTGIFARNSGIIPKWADPGIKFSAKTILRIGVVLLGLRLSIPQVIKLGFGPVVVILVTVTATYLVTLWLGRLMKIAHATAVLTSTGTAICGAAAVAGMSSVVRSTGADDSVDTGAATAVAAVTLFGTFAMIFLPPLTQLLGLTPMQTGVWIGSAIHEVGQVVASAKFISPEVTNIATITKLGRVVLLAPLVGLVGFFESRAYSRRLEERLIHAEVASVLAGNDSDNTAVVNARPPIMPLFVIGFLAMVVLRSVIGSPEALLPWFGRIDVITNFLLTLAMGAMGAGVHMGNIIRSGIKGIALGAIACLVAGLVSLGLTLTLV